MQISVSEVIKEVAGYFPITSNKDALYTFHMPIQTLYDYIYNIEMPHLRKEKGNAAKMI